MNLSRLVKASKLNIKLLGRKAHFIFMSANIFEYKPNVQNTQKIMWMFVQNANRQNPLFGVYLIQKQERRI